MIFHYLDKIVDYRLKQEDNKLKKEIILKDLKNYLKKSKSKLFDNFYNIKRNSFNKNYETIVLSKVKIIKIKNDYNPIITEYAIAKELSEKGFSTFEQSIITKKLKSNKII